MNPKAYLLAFVAFIGVFAVANSEAGPFARFRAHRQARIAQRIESHGFSGPRLRWHTARAGQIDARQDRVETRRWGCVRTAPGSYRRTSHNASTTTYQTAYYPAETAYVVSEGSSGSYGSAGSYQAVSSQPVAPAASAGSYGASAGSYGSSSSAGVTAYPESDSIESAPAVVESPPVAVYYPQQPPTVYHNQPRCFVDAFGRRICH